MADASLAASPSIDQAKAPRAGEELPLPQLTPWLEKSVPGLQPPFTVTQFPKGHSNLTYLITDKAGRELVLRRPPQGSKVKTAHDMGREVRVLSALSPLFKLAPMPLAHCDDLEVIGAPFYVMDRLRGIILRGQGPAKPIPPGQKRKIDLALVDTLADLHAVDTKNPAIAALGKPAGYIERQVTGWTKRYQDSQTDDIPAVAEAAQWLAAHMPEESGAAVIHNDYKFDNVILDPGDLTKVIGLLDWEMSTLGDPLMDLGTALAYWAEAGDRDELKQYAFGPTFVPGSITRREFVEQYAKRSGREVGDLTFHLAFSLFKNAVVAQQIYARYKAGLTHDERFAALIFVVKLVADESLSAIARGHV